MVRTGIKICGLRTPEAVDKAISERADHAGFVFFPRSPRHLSIEEAAVLSRHAGTRISKVAVTVNADDQFLAEIMREVRPDWLQLHGDETPERIREVRLRFGVPVIKSVSIRDAADFGSAAECASVSDRLLFDARPPEGSDLPGGNGVSFDWNLLRVHASGYDYFLSGGLDAANVAQALARSGANLVDVSSGVESSPGVKDFEKISAFVKTVRDFDIRRLAGSSGSRQQAGSA